MPSQETVLYRKKFSKPHIVKAIKRLSKEWLMSEMDVCTVLISDGAVKALEKIRENNLSALRK